MHIREYDEYVTTEYISKNSSSAGVSGGNRPYLNYTGAGIGGGIHPYYEVFYIDSGEVLVQWIGHTYRVQSPALFLLTPNSPHLFTRLSTQLQFWFVEWEIEESDLVPDLETITRWNRMQSDLTRDFTQWPLIEPTLQTITTMIRTALSQKRPPIFDRLLACDIQKLLLLIEHSTQSDLAAASSSGLGANTIKPALHDPIYDLIRYMEGFYQTDISLALLAERSGLTPSYIIRLFKERIGVTPIQYLLELRMHSATCYLQLTDMSVQDIAETSGFPSIHYFSRMFKQRFGVSPSDWKRKYRLPLT
ncbi:Transcriptional activator NphR [compost metagenome]